MANSLDQISPGYGLSSTSLIHAESSSSSTEEEEGIKNFATAMTHMPKDIILTSTLTNLLVSLLKDLATFASEQNPKVFPQNQDVTLSKVSWFQGSLTLAQVLTRQLAPGETRLGLVGRCLKILENKKMGVEPSLKQKASQFKDGK